VSGVRQFDALERVNLPAGPVHLAIGMFDGVHRGHQAVIRSAIEAAHTRGGGAGVLTFEPHPSVIVRPESPAKLLFPPEIKRRLLTGLGIDFFIVHPFTPSFAATTARAFVTQLKRALPGLETVYVGENFRFGRGREGDIAVLQSAARDAGFTVFSTPRLAGEGAPISSSRLRELIATGGIEQANALLGYSYFAEGVVLPGKQLGRTLGFPTLNVAWSPGLRPALGVYAVTIEGTDGRAQPGVANYGLRPTVETGATEPRLEVHVLDGTRLTYGDHVTVRWLRFLRPERKFAGVEELRAQVESDRENARAAHAQLSPQNPPKSA
jgi:riboflavin kinase/FMN adenylyltransferase